MKSQFCATIIVGTLVLFLSVGCQPAIQGPVVGMPAYPRHFWDPPTTAPPPKTVPIEQVRYQSQDETESRGQLFDPSNQQFYVDSELEGQLGQRQVVQDVVIEGNRRVPTAEILRQLKTRPGRYFDPDLLQQDVQAIWKMSTIRRVHGPFLNRTGDGITVTFQVEEHPFISELKFVGNRVLSDSYLRKETGLDEGCSGSS